MEGWNDYYLSTDITLFSGILLLQYKVHNIPNIKAGHIENKTK